MIEMNGRWAHVINRPLNRPSDNIPPKIKRQTEALMSACTMFKSDWLKKVIFNQVNHLPLNTVMPKNSPSVEMLQ